MIKNFTIMRRKGDNTDPKTPSHNISVKVGDKYQYIGACWTKNGNYGAYLSCQLDKSWKDHTGETKSKEGYSIVNDKELRAPAEAPTAELADDVSEIPF